MSCRLALALLTLWISATTSLPAVGGSNQKFRTPWGDPDIQGVWSSSGATPLERPESLAGRTTLTDQEVAQLEEQRKNLADRPPRDGDPGTYNAFWTDLGKRTNQTSLIVDPANGRLPELTTAGEAAKTKRKMGADSWEDRHLWERCITRGGLPNAMLPRGYNNNAEIVQAPGYVAILLEEIHETRLIPLDQRPHMPDAVRQWMGDSRGHWEGQALVIDSSNFADRVSALQPWAAFSSVSGSGHRLHIVERITRVDADTIDYRMSIDDPEMYVSPWTVAFPLVKSDKEIYEYACHEGNYGMYGILSGARAQEKAAAAGKKKGSEQR